jgi:hypothetical protein
MNPKKPIDTLTWKKNNKYIKIDKIHHQTIYINKDTGKQAISIEQVDKIPPIKRKHKHK